jgi:6-phosphogluconolactonase
MQRSLRLAILVAVATALAGVTGCGTTGSMGKPGNPTTPGGTNPQSAARFVFALDATEVGNSSLAGFSFNSSNGMLTPISGSPFSTSPFGSAMAATPQTKFVYVADWRNQNIIIYRADSNSGALMQTATFSTPNIQFPAFILVSPNGQTLYVSDSNGFQIWAFAIASDGSLSAVSGSPFKLNQAPTVLTMNNAGTLLFVSEDNQIAGFNVGAGGTLTAVPGSPTVVRPPFITAGKGPTNVRAAIDTAGRFLFVADSTSMQMFVYSVAASGALTQVVGSPFQDQVFAGAVAVSPNGQFVFVAGFDSAQVAALSVNQGTGALTPVAGSPFDNGPFRNGGAPISDAHVDPTGKFLLTADSDQGKITVFSIDQNSGALTNVAGSPFTAAPVGGGSPGVIQLTQ